LPVVASKNSVPLEIFSGWKEIAHYLRKGVRTVQRCERELGLPIQRPNGESSGSVIATKVELDGWVNATPTQVGSLPKRWPTERTNKLGAQLLLIDSEIALTFFRHSISDERPRKKKTQDSDRSQSI